MKLNMNGDTDLLQLVLDAMPHAVAVFKVINTGAGKDYDFELYALNAPALKLTGLLPISTIGKKISQSSDGNNGLHGNLKKAMESNVLVEWEYLLENKWLHNTIIRKDDLFFVTTENFTRHKQSEQDIFDLNTKHKQSEQDILDLNSRHKQSEQKIHDLNFTLLHKNRDIASLRSELATFNSIAATDYKETLRKLYTIMEFIVTNEARHLSNEGKANIRRGQSAIQKMKLLTEDMLSYSSILPLEADKVEVNLNEMINLVAEDLKNNHKEINLNLECEQLPKIHGYPLLISLLFHHIITNAIKFKKPDGDVYILIQCIKINGPQINHAEASPDLLYDLISITDHGIGFEQEHAKKIFGMFERLNDKVKYKGAGVGLAVCNKIMEIHDGFITAQGEVNKGATFNCYFPVS